MGKKKIAVTIPAADAIARLHKMIPLIEFNIKCALKIEAILEVGNDIVGKMEDKAYPGAGAYNMIKRSLSFDLALHLARLFDARPVRRRDKAGKMRFIGKHPNDRDVASIPLMIRLMRQQRCRSALREQALNWKQHHNAGTKARCETDCVEAIDRASVAYSNVFKGGFGRSGLMMLKKVRDNHIAHSLMSDCEYDVLYNHLFRLADDARDIVAAANIAIAGHSLQLERLEQDWRDEATEFWERALLGKIREYEMSDA